MENNRNLSIDALKGIGIVLMVLGHCTIGNNVILTNFIFSFHMPLFFLVSGYLYKEKIFIKLIQTNFKRIILPYLVTVSLIALFFLFKDGFYTMFRWIISVFIANGSGEVFNFRGHIGPLWFLITYFFSYIFFYLTLKINKTYYQVFLLAVLFVLSFIVKKVIGLLPLDILSAIIGCIFLYVGYNYKNIKFLFENRFFISIGIIIWGLCVYSGKMSMATHTYPLNFINVIGACYGVFVVHRIIKRINKVSVPIYRFLIFCGQNSLLFLCIHSIDYMCHFSGLPYHLFFETVDSPALIIFIRFILKSLIIILGYILVKRIKIIQSIFQIKKYPTI
jgi:fucose 4-O-acetylase-like acetyltransferase